MSMTKRIQIPIDEVDLALVKAAARRMGQPLAEWARAILRERARQELVDVPLGPREALDLLFGTEAPVADVDTLIDESVRGRLT